MKSKLPNRYYRHLIQKPWVLFFFLYFFRSLKRVLFSDLSNLNNLNTETLILEPKKFKYVTYLYQNRKYRNCFGIDRTNLLINLF